jgi:antitoxin CptB
VSDLPPVARLRRHCLRGMLELDLLLEAFLDRVYPQLDPDLQAAFARLLQAPDPQLHAWIMGSEPPEEDAFRPLLPLLRDSLHPTGNGHCR